MSKTNIYVNYVSWCYELYFYLRYNALDRKVRVSRLEIGFITRYFKFNVGNISCIYSFQYFWIHVCFVLLGNYISKRAHANTAIAFLLWHLQFRFGLLWYSCFSIFFGKQSHIIIFLFSLKNMPKAISLLFYIQRAKLQFVSVISIMFVRISSSWLNYFSRKYLIKSYTRFITHS